MFIVAVSSRSLFNIEDGHKIYKNDGFFAYKDYMRKTERKPLKQGAAFELVRKLLALNTPEKQLVKVVLLSSNSLEAGARVMYSLDHYKLPIDQAFFTSGKARFQIAKALNVSLFLTTNPDEVRNALDCGIPSATVAANSKTSKPIHNSLCIAFDGDAVLFSDEAEQVNQSKGLDAFHESERMNASIALQEGPFKSVFEALVRIQQEFIDLPRSERPVRVALVTARAAVAFERVLVTFRKWGLEVDDALFCGGSPKGPLLEALGADLFFDDGPHHIELASLYVPSCHVPHGIVGANSTPRLSLGSEEKIINKTHSNEPLHVA